MTFVWLTYLNAVSNIASIDNGVVYFQAGIDKYFPREIVSFNTSGHNSGELTQHHLYVDDMLHDAPVILGENNNINQINGIIILPDFYGNALVYLGRDRSLPAEISIHTHHLGCISDIKLDTSSGLTNVPVEYVNSGVGTLSLDLNNKYDTDGCKYVANLPKLGKVCGLGNQAYIASLPGVGYGIEIDRTKSEASVCFYKSKSQEIDHLSDGFTVTVLIVFFAVWMSWTKHIHNPFDARGRSFTWNAISVTYIVITADVTFYVVTLGFASRLKEEGAHQLHSLATVRVFGQDFVNSFAFFHTMIAMPLLGLFILLILFYGGSKARLPDQPKIPFFGWGYQGYANTLLTQVIGIFVTVSIIIAVYFFWDYVSDGDITTTVIVTLYSALLAVGMANSSALRSIIQMMPQPWSSVTDKDDVMLLLALRFIFEFMVLSTILISIPFELSNQLSEEFSSGVSLLIGSVIIIIAARDVAYGLAAALSQKLSILSFMLSTVFALAATYIMIWVVVFASAIFAENGALRNKSELSLLGAVSFFVQVFAITFVVTATRHVSVTRKAD